jgi:hypothetical protein
MGMGINRLAVSPRRIGGVVVSAVAVSTAALTLALGLIASSPARATPPSGTTNACNYVYEWIGKIRFPLQPDPHAVYSAVFASNQAGLDGIGFVVHGEFPHSVWSSWATYTGRGDPFSVTNLVNNPPKNTNNPAVADPGSIDPFTNGQPMLGTPRNFTLLFRPEGYTGATAPTLAGIPTSSINPANIKPYPVTSNAGKFWLLANRVYVAFPGYNPGGSTKSTFPTVTAVNLATGAEVDCQTYNVGPDRLQRPPTNPPDALFYGNRPTRVVLKNGSVWVGSDGSQRGGGQFSPPSPKGLLVFTRPKALPGGDLATIPPPDNCSGYVGASLNPGVISLIRFPHIANYTDGLNVTSSSTYPNPVDPSRPWEASYESLVQYGAASGIYKPGSPNTATVADAEFKVDSTGGSTIVIWPRILGKAAKLRVVRYANRKKWAIVRGGQRGRRTGANMLIRVKAAASDYFGSISAVPCYFGTPQEPKNSDRPWSAVPVGSSSKFVATAKNMGTPGSHGGVVSAAPQGVTCRSVRTLTNGKCLARLKRHIKSTGGSYRAPAR